MENTIIGGTVQARRRKNKPQFNYEARDEFYRLPRNEV